MRSHLRKIYLMIKESKKNILILTLIIIFISLFLKVDFRLKSELECCVDDHDYYIHAETSILDFDFDYSNQLEGFETRRNFINDKSSPIGFYGTGLLSAPFLFIGNIFDKLTGHDTVSGYTNKVIVYSFASVFYLFFTFALFVNIKKELKIKLPNFVILLFFLGTGLPYYAFERYSMTHVYDTFTVTALIYFLILFYKGGSSKYLIFISAFNLLTLMTRWTNYQVFILPFIIKRLFFKNSVFLLRRKKEFYIYTLSSIFIFLTHAKAIWGIYTLNPRKIYTENQFISSYIDYFISNPFRFILDNISDSFTTLFTQEFGVFWFSPVIFFGILYSFNLLKKDITLGASLLLIFSFFFATVNAWQSTANAYGFRYLYPLISLSIILYYHYAIKDRTLSKLTYFYLFIFSLLSIFSVLFFEGWTGTQLSLVEIENSFGKVEKFIQPEYLSGLLKGVFILETYLKIFTTSFLGLIFIKLILLFSNIPTFNIFLSNFGLPVQNTDFQNYLLQIDQISIFTIFLAITMILILSLLVFNLLFKD
jgi:hypothetical protein